MFLMKGLTENSGIATYLMAVVLCKNGSQLEEIRGRKTLAWKAAPVPPMTRAQCSFHG
jgi:hypothetical protein